MPDPPVVSLPGFAVVDNLVAGPDPPVASYPGSASFANQPAVPWRKHRDDLKGPDRSR